VKNLFVSGRREIKYLVDAAKFGRLDKILRPVLKLDRNNPNDQGYFNHSIYFDSPTFRFWHEKQEGLEVRVKPRLRVYKSCIDGAPLDYFLELKHRHGHFVSKERVRVSAGDAHALLNGAGLGAWSTHEAEVLRKFSYLQRRHNLVPVVGVMYHRFAYAIPMHNRLRITYDKRIQCSRTVTLDCPPEVYQHVAPPYHTIIELKYDEVVPNWLANVLDRLELRQISYSKYGESMAKAHATWLGLNSSLRN